MKFTWEQKLCRNAGAHGILDSVHVGQQLQGEPTPHSAEKKFWFVSSPPWSFTQHPLASVCRIWFRLKEWLCCYFTFYSNICSHCRSFLTAPHPESIVRFETVLNTHTRGFLIFIDQSLSAWKISRVHHSLAYYSKKKKKKDSERLNF